MDLEQFNHAPSEDLRPQLLACCDVPRFADSVLQGRPYASPDDVAAAADAAAASLAPEEVDRALAAHPRIGERAAGKGTEAAWSRAEQGSVSRDDDTQAALLDGNRVYEERFGRVFLICATGLSGTEILGALQARLANNDSDEVAVVADELRKIAVLRTRKVLQ